MNRSDSLLRRDILRDMAVGGGLALAQGGRSSKLYAVDVPQVTPEELQIDSVRLQAACELLEKWTAGPDAPVPSAAIGVGRFGKLAAVRWFGRQGPEPDAEPIRHDALFYMASITKPVICIAAMILVERGQLNLSDKVLRYIPEFQGEGREHVQVLHLFTHTSGLPDELPNNGELRNQHASLQRFVEEVIHADLLFPPGTRVSYSSSAIILLAEIIQRISGVTIREFVLREVIEPLGLKSTGLGSIGFSSDRIVRATLPDYQVGNRGHWNTRYWQEFGSPAGGLLSTPSDMAVICALMLTGGKYGEVRLLSPASVRMMTTNRLHDLPDLPESVRRTQPWGLGWRLNHLGMADSWSDLLSRRVIGHTGSAGNLMWMNPDTQGFCVLLTNYLRARAPWRLVHLSNIVASAFV